jgi:cytochrome c-type protein NapB
LRVDERHAAMLSHALHESCTQCHTTAAAAPPPPGAPRSAIDNGFAGLGERTGERAYPGAPPTMPHPSFMRERCESCHGVLGLGIRTTHPWRASCPQCHAPSAALDQRAPER